jgi:phage baseplate assembly protein W
MSALPSIAFPYAHEPGGRTAPAAGDDHIRQMIEQVIFTAPGERVNRPTFGSGILQLVFAPASEQLVATTRLLVQSALQTWLGDIIDVADVTVEAGDGTLRVSVSYIVRTTGNADVAQFERAT